MRQYVPLDASVANPADSEHAADALTRVIEKGGFVGMAWEEVGLFSLGFTVVRQLVVHHWWHWVNT